MESTDNNGNGKPPVVLPTGEEHPPEVVSLDEATSVLEVPNRPTGGVVWDQSMINFKRSAMNDEDRNEGTGAHDAHAQQPVVAHFQPATVREPGLPTTNTANRASPANHSDGKQDYVANVPLPRNSKSKTIGRGLRKSKNKDGDSAGNPADSPPGDEEVGAFQKDSQAPFRSAQPHASTATTDSIIDEESPAPGGPEYFAVATLVREPTLYTIAEVPEQVPEQKPQNLAKAERGDSNDEESEGSLSALLKNRYLLRLVALLCCFFLVVVTVVVVALRSGSDSDIGEGAAMAATTGINVEPVEAGSPLPTSVTGEPIDTLAPTTNAPSSEQVFESTDGPTVPTSGTSSPLGHSTDEPAPEPTPPAMVGTLEPSSIPVSSPSSNPTDDFVTSTPTGTPSRTPSSDPTQIPSESPTSSPSRNPTQEPSFSTLAPTPQLGPSRAPSPSPLAFNTSAHEGLSTGSPTTQTAFPAGSANSTFNTSAPTGESSLVPTVAPSSMTSSSPTETPSGNQTVDITNAPSFPATIRTLQPTVEATDSPSLALTAGPSEAPATKPFKESSFPTTEPTLQPASGPAPAPALSPWNVTDGGFENVTGGLLAPVITGNISSVPTPVNATISDPPANTTLTGPTPHPTPEGVFTPAPNDMSIGGSTGSFGTTRGNVVGAARVPVGG